MRGTARSQKEARQMATTLDDLRVIIRMDDSEARKRIDEIIQKIAAVKEQAKNAINLRVNTKQTEEVVQKVDKVREQTKKARDEMRKPVYTPAYKELKTELEAIGKEFDALMVKNEALKQKLAGLYEMQAEAAAYAQKNGQKAPLADPMGALTANEREALAAEERLAARYHDVEDKMKAMEKSRTHIDYGRQVTTFSDTGFKNPAPQGVNQAQRWGAAQAAAVKAQKEAMAAARGAAATPSYWDKMSRPVEKAVPPLERVKEKMKQVGAQARAMGARVAGAGRNFATMGATAAKNVKSTAGWAAQLHSGFGKVFSRIPLLNKFTFSLTGGAKAMSKFANQTRKGLFKGLGIGGLARMTMYAGGIYLLFSGMREGMKNLAQYSSRTNSDISQLISALLQLKNALATAFAPILTIITPALVGFINMLTKAATAVAHFLSALTGKSTVVVAKKVYKDYAASLDTTTKKTNKADKAAKKYQKTLMGFDIINKLEEKIKQTKDKDADTGVGGISPSDMFDTVPVSNAAKKWADMFKEAWKKGDFTEIGKILAEKLNKALAKIPWDKIKRTARKLGKSLATFLNGFIENADWRLIGKTIAEGLNTGVEFAFGFAKNFHWDSLGKGLAEGVNGFFLNFDWAKLGKTITLTVSGIFTTIYSFFETVDWDMVTKQLVKFFKNIDYSKIASAAAEAAGAIVGALSRMLATLGQEIWKAIKKYFKKKIEEAGGNIMLGILKGIVGIITGIPKWFAKHIVLPFIKGFKKAFGISSPAKKMIPLGKEIILGVLSGLKKKLKDILDWFKGLPKKILEALKAVGGVVVDVALKIGEGIGDFAGWVGEHASEAVEIGVSLAKKGWATVKGWIEDNNLIGGVVSAFVGLAKKGWDKVKSWVEGGDNDGGDSSHGISLGQSGWSSVRGWVDNNKGDTTAIKQNIGLGKNDKSPDENGNWKGVGVTGWINALWPTSTIFQFIGLGKVNKKPDDKGHWKGVGVTGWVKALFPVSTITQYIGLGKKKKTADDKGNWWKSGVTGWVKSVYPVSTIWQIIGLTRKGGKYNKGGWKGWTVSYWAYQFIGSGVSVGVSLFKYGWKSIKEFLTGNKKGKVTIKVEGGGGGSWATGAIYKGGSWHPVTTAASGGAFNTGQMFVAREAGPELVGNINGHTAVMNNDQIVSSVAAGVYNAVLSAMQAKGNGNVTVVLEGDARGLFKAVKAEAKNYTNATGRAAFPV